MNLRQRPQQLQKMLPVPLPTEDRAPLVAAGEHVMPATRYRSAQRSNHGRTSPRHTRTVKKIVEWRALTPTTLPGRAGAQRLSVRSGTGDPSWVAD